MEQFEKVPSSVHEIPHGGDTFQSARERLGQTLTGVGEQAKHAAQYADQAVHANPWTSIGVGFGIGVLVGALVVLSASSRRIF